MEDLKKENIKKPEKEIGILGLMLIILCSLALFSIIITSLIYMGLDWYASQ